MPETEGEGSNGRDLSHVPKQLRPHLFKPGESGNPGGMPKGYPRTVSAVLKQAMQEGGVELAVQGALEILSKPSHKFWFPVFREVMDRTEGKVADRIHHEMKRFEEGIELRDGRSKDGPVPLPTIVEQPEEERPAAPDRSGDAGPQEGD